MLRHDLQQRLPEILKKKTKPKSQGSTSTDDINLENASVDILFEKFDEDEVSQIDIELPDFDTNNNELVMEEFFDMRIFEEQIIIEEGSQLQENTISNEDWSIDYIFRP
ncbi:9297_t:CDS:1 [Dentiscutata heterogama]|uniref:9297_t:CDS:1 n=1 Tax=Dentiscutata heterogama TaxID=1316150 RepID=A0ACA9M680_9GLOM|nr:9297_t:CDS:1 [Dentiscutata heterogama]